jgi:hypothetical protein
MISVHRYQHLQREQQVTQQSWYVYCKLQVTSQKSVLLILTATRTIYTLSVFITTLFGVQMHRTFYWEGEWVSPVAPALTASVVQVVNYTEESFLRS